MKKVLWSIFLTVVCLFLTVQCVPAPSDIQSFGAFHWSSVSKGYTDETSVTTIGRYVQLRGTFSDTVTPQNVTIRRLDQDGHLNQTYDESLHSLSVTLGHVTCDQQGTYVCEYKTQKKMLDLGITDCGPKLCNNESNPKIVYAKVNEPTHFSVCIVVQNINKVLYINNNAIKEDGMNNTWTWTSTYNEYDNFRHYLNFSVRNILKKDYKTYNITLTSQTTETKMAETFLVELKETGVTNVTQIPAPSATITNAASKTTTTTTTITTAATTTETTKDNNSQNSSQELTTLQIIITILVVLTVITVTVAVIKIYFHCRRTSTSPFYSVRYHAQEPAQQNSLIDTSGNGAHYENVNFDEPVYENETKPKLCFM